MNSLPDQLLVLVLLCNVMILGTRRTRVAVRSIAAQGVILGGVSLLVGPVDFHAVLLALLVVAAKGCCIPWLLLNAAKKADVNESVRPLLGYSGSILAGAAATIAAFFAASRLPLAPEHQGLLLVPVALATMLAGFIALITRRKAINQVIGYLLLENGIFIFGQLLTEAMPLMVEAGVLLDLIAGIFVMVIVISQISREFSSLDTSRMTNLREVE